MSKTTCLSEPAPAPDQAAESHRKPALDPTDQTAVIAFLADPATHGGRAVGRVDGHRRALEVDKLADRGALYEPAKP